MSVAGCRVDCGTPQPLYNTIVGVFRVSYPNHVVTRVKYIGYVGKGVLNSHLGPTLIRVISKTVTMNCVIKRFR